MAIIPQRSLFRWEDVEELGDLERLRLVLSALPDEVLLDAPAGGKKTISAAVRSATSC